MKELILMILENKLKNLEQRIMIISLNSLVFLVKEDLVFTLRILIKEESGLKMKKAIILSSMQMEIQLRKCLFHLIWIRW